MTDTQRIERIERIRAEWGGPVPDPMVTGARYPGEYRRRLAALKREWRDLYDAERRALLGTDDVFNAYVDEVRAAVDAV